MRRASFRDMNCSVAQSLEVIGEWWTLLILRDVFLGVTRFETLHERLGVARNILAARLGTLVDAGVLERRVYDSGRGRADYVLTDKGRALWPVLTAIRQWGDDWVVGRRAAPIVMEHAACGAPARAEMVCSQCHEPLHPTELRLVDGPGAQHGSLLPSADSRGGSRS